jgi:glutathione synthase/RimK-type ligase-like ATP-grasp enzyme
LISAKHLKKLGLIGRCPTLFQQAIEKTSDVRICYLDGTMTAVELVALECGEQRTDIRRNNMNDVQYRVLKVPPDVTGALHKLLRFYKLRFAAIDFVIDKQGKWVFLEINPNGQWAWLDLEGGANIAEHFILAFS